MKVIKVLYNSYRYYGIQIPSHSHGCRAWN